MEVDKDVPILGLFKERSEGAGHSYGATAVRGFVDMTEEAIAFSGPPEGASEADEQEQADTFRLLTLRQMDDAHGTDDSSYINTSFEKLTAEQIDNFKMTPGYRAFLRMMYDERGRRPAALRDVLAFPADITYMQSAEDIKREMKLFNRRGNLDFVIRGLECDVVGEGKFLPQAHRTQGQRFVSPRRSRANAG